MSICYPATGDETHVPGPPKILTAIAGDGKVIVTWSFPSAGSIQSTGYTVTSSPGNFTKTWIPGPLSVEIIGLTNGTAYTFTVTANNTFGFGPPSQPSISVIPGTPLSPTMISAVAYNSSAVVSWSASLLATSYIVTSSPGDIIVPSTGITTTVNGLTNGILYTFTVTPVNSFGSGPASFPSNSVTPKGVPDAPIVSAQTNKSDAVLTWLAPSAGGSPIINYTISSIPASFTITTTNLAATIVGLTGGTTYVFLVTAVNAFGGGPPGLSQSILIAGKPGAPTNVIATIYDTSANVTWTAAPDNGSPITRYTVSSIPAGITVIVNDPSIQPRIITNLSVTIFGLTVDVDYTFTVTATNEYGNGPVSLPSNSILKIGLPGAPLNVVAVAGDSVSTISWKAPPDNGSPISLYTVRSNPIGYISTTSNLTTSITGLTNGLAYTFTVFATNAVGPGPVSFPSNRINPGRVPDAPTIGSAIANSSSATISWFSPPNNGSTIIRYTVTSSPEDIIAVTNSTSVIVQGLTNGIRYTFTVNATNALGTGPSSFSSLPIIPKGPPGAPSIGDLTAGNGTVTLNWTVPESYGVPISYYTVSLIPGGTTVRTSNLSTTISGLTNGLNYLFRVNATNAYGTGPSSVQSKTIMPSGNPGAPRNVLAIAKASSAQVLWAAPPSNGGYAIIRYTVTSTPDNIEAIWSSGPLTLEIPGLINGTSYSFTITATNSFGTGLPSAASNSILPGAPGAPINVTATAGNAQVSLVWTNPSGNGSPITYYDVYPNPDNGVVGTINIGAENGGTSTCIVTGLTNGIAYTFSVTASNILSTGPYSVPSNSVTPSLPLTVPSAPTNIVATSGDAQVTLTWADISNGGSPIINNTITGGGVPGLITRNGQNASTIIKNLTNGATYIFAITSTNSLGTGPPGYSESVIPSTIPGRPINVVAVKGSSSAFITWVNPHNNGFPILYYSVTSDPNQGVAGIITQGPDGGGASSCTYTGLTNGTPYTFSVTATNSVGTSIATVSNSVIPQAVPSPPTNITAFAYDAVVSLTWTNAAGNGIPILYYTVTGGGIVGTITTGATTSSCTVTGLINGTNYTFSITATSEAGTGTSGISNTVQPNPPFILDFNGFLSITLPITGGSVMIDYGNGIPVSSLSGSVSGPVQIFGQFTSFGSISSWQGAGSLLRVQDWPALQNLSYAFNGASSLTSVPTTLPSSVKSTAGMFKGALAFSSNVSNWNVSNVTDMSFMFQGATSFTAAGLNNWTPTSCTNMNGMFSGTSAAYSNNLFITNLSGWPSTATNIEFFSPDGLTNTTFSDPHSPFYAGPVPTAPTNVSASAINSTSATISWIAPSGTVTGYTIISSPATTTQNASTTSMTFTGLTFGISYTFTVSASNLAGPGPFSSPSNSITLLPAAPDAPTSVTATPISSTSASITWTAPSGPVTGYTIISSPATTTQNASTNSMTFTGLTFGTSYTFTVSATNISGSGPFSSPSNSITLLPPAPDPPTNVIATPISSTSASITWTAPSGPVTGYTIISSPATTTQNASTNSMTFTGLTYGTSYTFTVSATNISGSGPFSSPSNSITPLPPTPNQPTNVIATLITSTTSASITWTAPSGPVTGYTIISSPATTTQTSSATSMTFIGLTYGTSYTFTVSATNISGSGPFSSPSNSISLPPGPPTNVTAVSSTSISAIISWTAPSGTITGYTIISSPATTTQTSSATSMSFIGLTSGTSYTFTVSATNTAGSGPFSSPSNSVTIIDNRMITLHFTGTPTITLPIKPILIDYLVDFGDGIPVASNTGRVSGNGTVNIFGAINGLGLITAQKWSNDTLTRVSYWSPTLNSFSYAFYDEENLTSVPSTLPSSVTNTSFMFQGATSFNQNISGWNVSSVTNMNSMFESTSAFYTNTTSTGRSLINLTLWPRTAAAYTRFFSPDGSTDTSELDLNSPFYTQGSSMSLTFTGGPTITLPITGGTVYVDFGDGVKRTSLSGPVSGTVLVYGSFTTFGSVGWSGVSSLRSVISWPYTLTNLSNAFNGATNLTSVPSTLPSVTNTTSMFQGATSFNQDISGWNVSMITNMTSMFQGATLFNQNLSSWTPTACTAMDNMFRGATSLYTSGLFKYILHSWPGTATHSRFFSPDGTTDTSETDPNSPFIPTMTLIFSGFPSIQLPISGGSPQVDFGNGIRGASLNGTVSGPVRVFGTFTTFGSPGWQGSTFLVSISNWPLSITSLNALCYGASNLTSVPSFLPSAVTDMAFMFQNATSFNQDLSGWNVSTVRNMASMFNGASSFTSSGLPLWNPTACTNMDEMFRGSGGFSNGFFTQNLTRWPSTATFFFFFYPGSIDTSRLDPNSPFYTQGFSMSLTFTGGPTITLPITGGTVYVDFGDGVKRTSLSGPVSGTVRVYGSFTGFGSVGWQGVSSLVTVNSWPSTLINFSNAFNGATSLISLPSSITSSVKNTTSMFQGATILTQDLTTWNLTETTAMDNMFRGATALYSNNLFTRNITSWSSTATHSLFFSPDGTTDTSETDTNSPFFGPSMILHFSGGAITLPIITSPFPPVYIDYGNGIRTTSLSGNGNPTVNIYGSFTKFGADIWPGASSLTSVEKWPSTLIDLYSAFSGATQLTSVPSTIPASVRIIHNMFGGATSFNQDISGWNVSNITNAQSLFSGATAFNRNISAWNVSNITTMNSMFRDAISFTATDLDRWTPTSCNTITGMFRGTTAAYNINPSFPQYSTFKINLTKWQTAVVRADYKEFFFSPDVTNDSTTFDPNSPFYTQGFSMSLTFTGVPTITLPITGGTVYVDYGDGVKRTSLSGPASGTVRVYGSFTGFGSVGWQGVSSLVTVSSWPWTVNNFSNAFNGATNLGSVPSLLPSRTNVSNFYPVTDTSSMFKGATGFNQDISLWATQIDFVTNMESMFQGALAFSAANLNQWNPRRCINMNNMFRGTSTAYTNNTASGTFIRNLTSWPRTATNLFFFSPDGTTDTSKTDTNSPFYGL